VLVFTRYTADNPNFRYSGRIDFSTAKSPRFAEGAVHILARFKGTALRVLLNDEFRYGTYRDYFEVVIDGSERHKLTPVLGKTAYDVTQTLSDAEHNVVISKRTEASIGLGRFLGLEIAGELLSAPAAELHRLEIVGDSISAGSGNEALDGSTQCSEDGWGQPYQNGDLAYGPVLARSLNADYHVTAVSGIGLVRNYSSMYDARPMPEVYNLLFVDSKTSPAWDTTLYVPEAIVVMLGTNDFSPGDNPPDNPRAAMEKSVYRDAYIAFVDKLHGYYPNAHVFGVSSPMLGDGWPNSTDTFASDLKAVLSDVEAHYAGDAVPLFHKFFVNKINGTGCGTHPSVAQHADMASQLAPFVKNVMGW
jgi:lysophospholipase L1-like esterase